MNRRTGWKQIGLAVGVAVLCVLLSGFPLLAQGSNPSANEKIGNEIDGYPVMLDDQILFRVLKGIPDVVSAQRRAEIINNRLVEIANDPTIAPTDIDTQEVGKLSVIKVGDQVIFTVRDEDIPIGNSRQAVAETVIQKIRAAVIEYRQERSPQQILRGVILAILSTILFILFIKLLQWIVSKLLLKIRAARQTDSLNLVFRNYQILDSRAVSYLLTVGLRVCRLGLILASLYLYIPFVLSQFPATRSIGNSILSQIVRQGNGLVLSFVQYLPNLVIIAVVIFVAYYLVGFANLVIRDLGESPTYSWFYPEWIQPTERIIAFLIIAATFVIIGPYLPGANSPAFRGVSLFIGALLTLGSSSAVSNAISGIIVIYTRAFQIGDYIRVGETVGEVSEKSLFVTRIITPKQELITIPNSSILNSNVTNYSAISRESKIHLVLHTTITLGYDVPWRQVHEVMIAAAQATQNVLPNPQPFVLQTALNDFNVSYELNAYTDHPKLMPRIYSELHQNLQDYCNEAGIEILSPSFSALRDGNNSTMPKDYLPQDYTAPGFQIHNSKKTDI